MNQLSAEFVVRNQIPPKKEIEKSELRFVIENFSQMPNKSIVSPKVQLMSVKAVWWATVSKYPERIGKCYRIYTFGVKILQRPECSSKHIRFIAKGMVNHVELSNRAYLSINKNGEGRQEFEVMVYYHPDFPQSEGSRALASAISSRGSLVVNFSLSVEHDCNEYTLSKFYDPTFMKNQILSNNNQLLIDSKYSDFEFTVKGTTFKVHKVILGPASEVFANLFASEMEESKTNKCEVSHLDPIAFGHMLKFIYSSKLPADFNAEVAQGLFEVAHYYDIKELKNICEQEVLFGLNADNAFDLFALAQLYDLEALEAKSWVIVKRDVLKIYQPLKKEPLTLEEINGILIQQQEESEYWKKILLSPPTKRWKAAED